jgi:hypothetical protein
MKLNVPLPKIAESEKSPLVQQLLFIIEQQAGNIEQLYQQVQRLKDEIARLKNQPPRPKISPSRLGKKGSGKKKQQGKNRAGSKKRKKTAQIQIHETIKIPLQNIPKGATFKGYKPFVVQGIKITLHNIKYLLATYETADGKYICSKLPEDLNGKHFSPELIRFILYQYHHCGVTQPLLLEQLLEFGIDISKGRLNSILNENKQEFHEEKERILAAGPALSR